ncbi:DNA-directed RNA polymerase subunit alpha [Candidatus Dependentiae bacterium]|nr:DNA-directed RNA polymerase subunit alpha [Candidatus Dependentiae bacterium]MBU4387605.1 DNA-directed RNA polymerase subunit alpha [Candidatus Dependentiae bacterium]MCG2756273.1 DNA-directed RNA polymerase subunit alpha [Candidatus Dependentiae bacterium]
MLDKVYKPLTLPTVKWEKKTVTDTFGELIAQPLEPGFGITLGNALRRVILSSVEGCAVTSVIIKGVNNEFSTLKGVIEDTLQILLNIKQIVLKNNTGLPGKMNLSISGENVVRVSDIVADEHLELINKDHVIAHLAHDGKLEIEFFVEMGRGYLPAQWPMGTALQEDGKIYLDAMFSPIRKVEIAVEKTRVGQSIDYDKLKLSIDTNGAANPTDIVHYATSVLRTQLEHFLHTDEIPFNEISEDKEESTSAETTLDAQGPTKGLPVDLFLKPIDELEFSVRAHNCLVVAGIKRVIDLVNLTDDDLLKIKNFGRKSLREVKEILTAFGLHLGMNVKELDLKKVIKKQEDSLKS